VIVHLALWADVLRPSTGQRLRALRGIHGTRRQKGSRHIDLLVFRGRKACGVISALVMYLNRCNQHVNTPIVTG
jgi:hypothetical protein